MLKRRASKRFVLAETGEETAWNTTTDNDATGVIPQIDIDAVQKADIEDEQLLLFQQQQKQLQESLQRLSVPQTLKPGLK
jgi:hypothetical protein